MSKPANPVRDLHYLLHRLMYGQLGEAEFAMLEKRLLEDPKARQLYREFQMLQIGLYSRHSVVLLGEKQAAVESQCSDDDLQVQVSKTPIADEDRLLTIQAKAERQLQAFLKEQERQRREQEAANRPSLGFLLLEATRYAQQKIQSLYRFTAKITFVSAVGLAALLLIVISVQIYYKYRIVAVLGDSVHAQWSQAPENEQLRAGTLFLKEGYAQLEFKRGATVIIEAPCQLYLHSPNKMILESGTVTAQVPESAHGFTIQTPSSDVIDYGTEFGVKLDAASQAEIQVFEGEVGVRSTARSQSSVLHYLSQGQNAFANWASGVQVGKAKYGEKLFVRKLPDPDGLGIPGKRIYLADIVGGGNGFGTGLTVSGIEGIMGTINPFTGRINDVTRPEWAEDPETVPPFMVVTELPFVDGLFIPDSCEGGLVISSKGHTFAECPDTDGRALKNIANGWNLVSREKTPSRWIHASGLSMHANLGITFDLQALRDVMPGIDIVRFTAQAGIPVSTRPETSEVVFWILVDGLVRLPQKSIRTFQMLDIDIPLGDRDRFLTLVVTDGMVARGGANRPSAWDSCFIADPVLELEMRHEN